VQRALERPELLRRTKFAPRVFRSRQAPEGAVGASGEVGGTPQTETDHPDEDRLAKALQRALDSPEPLKQTKRTRRGGRTKNGRSSGARRRRGEQQTT